MIDPNTINEVAKELQAVVEGENGKAWDEEDSFTKDVFREQAERGIKKYLKLQEEKLASDAQVSHNFMQQKGAA